MSALGDEKAIPLLESYASDPDSQDGREARRAIEQIRKEVGPPVPEEVNRLRGEVNDLRSQLQQLNGDIKTLREQFRESFKETAKEPEEASAKEASAP